MNADDIGNFTVTFQDNAFVGNTSAANVTNYLTANITVDFADPAALSYASTTLNESATNDGSISNSLVLTLTGDTFVADLTGLVAATNIPTALVESFTRDSNTQVSFTLTGNASAHVDANDISNLTVTFADGAFTNNATASNVTNYQNTGLIIDFIEPTSLAYSTGTFTEELSLTYDANTKAIYHMDGTVGSTTTFVDDSSLASPTNLTAVSGTPSLSSTKSKFGGVAYNSTGSYLQTGSNATFDFAGDFTVEGWFNLDTGLLTTYTSVGLLALDAGTNNNAWQINANDDGSLTLYGDNVGVQTAVATSATSLVSEATWHHIAVVKNGSGAGSWVVYLDGTAVITTDADAYWTTGNHNFLVGVDVWNTATTVEGYFDEIRVSDNARYTTGFTVASSQFGSLAYVGRIGNSITLTLTNGTFTGVNDDDFITDLKITIPSTPAGLTAKATRISDTQIVLTLEGEALNHTDGVHDLSNFQVTFEDTAFNNGINAIDVTNYDKTNIVIDYLD